jgi:hypothetical protein
MKEKDLGCVFEASRDRDGGVTWKSNAWCSRQEELRREMFFSRIREEE